MTVTTDTVDLLDEADALEYGGTTQRKRTASLFRWAVAKIERLEAELAETQAAYAEHVNAEDSAWKEEVARLEAGGVEAADEIEQLRADNATLQSTNTRLLQRLDNAYAEGFR